MVKILVIVAIVIAVAKFPVQSTNLGTKAIQAVVTVATGAFQTGKSLVSETTTKK